MGSTPESVSWLTNDWALAKREYILERSPSDVGNMSNTRTQVSLAARYCPSSYYSSHDLVHFVTEESEDLLEQQTDWRGRPDRFQESA